MPHAVVESISDTVIAFGRAPGGVDFEAVDSRPVRLFFMVVGPPEHIGRHLRILVALARLLCSGAFRESLLEAATPGEVLEKVRAEEERQG